MRADPLLTPFTIKHLTFKNRIMLSSHEPAYAEDGMPKDAYRAYHVERAKAGVALTMTAGSATVSTDSPPAFNNILLYKDECVPWLKALADECHDHGTAVMIQMTHLGRRTRWDKGDWLPSLSATHAREPAHRASPKIAEDWDIERIIKDFADAAERVKAAGLDGLELEAYGHLLDQFWSPLTNELSAPYGGSFDNRLRFIFDVLGAIRERVGEKFLIGVRFSADERQPGGIDAQAGLEIASRFKASGLVDFLNVIRGHIDTDSGLADVIPVQGMANAPFLDFVSAMRAHTGMPTFHAAKISDVATARYAIESGKMDMVGMTRAHIADPHIVRKIMAGQEDRIRPCVGATYCLDRIYQGGMALCIHNAATGRELTMPNEITPAPFARRVVIVGAGPGGLEAARVAAERGHKVIVFEAANEAGGQVRLTARSPRRKEMLSIIAWRMAECERLGVEFRFNTWAESADVLAESPDCVIIATGGYPDTPPLATGEDLVVSTWDILSGDVPPGKSVLLFDDAGDHAALQVAEMIVAGGGKIEIITPDRTFSPEIMGLNLVPYIRSLQGDNAVFTVAQRLEGVERSGNGLTASIGSDYRDFARKVDVDQVIVNCGTRPMDELYFELKPHSRNQGAVDYVALTHGQKQDICKNADGTFVLYRIGDAVSSRNTHAAIYDALRLMKDI
ncbi:FAD-dependent oxidoreductase [Acetobacter sp. TBRC 12305]|uniref:NADH:flavin oxidoreductase n=1 Tax=Acetobacter garciniae TaxID=2817435 RepID=A0A939HP61_9PROT|nr:NADH:flavin oxidoreductase [Acetobacter garciniae]MBO1325484.1 NADH:flavin oxidoreductase [Acetobacter garciniae]MBX0345344.1 FAD-dependent oxidoreductase [Acetobacter garciniae]